MTKIKRIIAACMLAVSLFLISSCSGENEMKNTTGFSQFEISYYWGPHGENAKDETFWQAVADCGFTSVPLENLPEDYNKAALTLMAKHGLTCSALWDSRIQTLIINHDTVTDEQIDATIKEVVEAYAEFDNIVGWWLYDEPGSDKFPILSKLVAAFKKYDPERETFIDLFPTYADAETQLKALDYKDYVDTYLSEVAPGYVCYDHYHFKQDEVYNGEQFFENFEIIRKASLENKLDYMSIILLTQHNDFANLTREQILFESNMCLTYGAKRLSFFTFILDPDLLELGWDNACMSHTGEIYPHYYDVKAVNEKLKPLGDELFGKNSKAVFHITTDAPTLEFECEAYTSYGKLKKVEGEDFVVGFFSDGSFMLTNKKYDDQNTLTFKSVKQNLEYFDVTDSTWKEYTQKDENGNYCYTAQGGEGTLFRVK